MKERIKNLIRVYTNMLTKTRSRAKRVVLENVIEDLYQVLKEAQ